MGEGNRMTKVQGTTGKGIAVSEFGRRWDSILLLRNPASSKQLAGPPREAHLLVGGRGVPRTLGTTDVETQPPT